MGGVRFRGKFENRPKDFQTVERFAGRAGYGALTYLTSGKPLPPYLSLTDSLMFYRPLHEHQNEKPAQKQAGFTNNQRGTGRFFTSATYASCGGSPSGASGVCASTS